MEANKKGVLPPEEEDEEHEPTKLPKKLFRPLEGADYSDSWDARVKSNLRQNPSAERNTIWGRAASLPNRQRLVFRHGSSTQINPSTSRHMRVLQLYRKGNALVDACQFCRTGEGPFRKCVVARNCGALNGACTNCAIREKGTGCDHHMRSLQLSFEDVTESSLPSTTESTTDARQRRKISQSTTTATRNISPVVQIQRVRIPNSITQRSTIKA